ncbi:MAG: putative low-affinity phosphate transport protein [Phycisphaerales bacterium]|nr:putative low-affinity phosphate transport protein [Phycisphaerales bacterium]
MSPPRRMASPFRRVRTGAFLTLVLLSLVGLLAFANGANDNGKGVATLVGFGAAKPGRALLFATIATAMGGAISFFLAKGLLKGFSGNWLFAQGIVLDRAFYAAALVGACGWVLLANRLGMPVSTTHAIIGALCGAGLVAFGHAQFHWTMLGRKFAIPLALSPMLSLAVVYVVAWPVLLLIGRIATHDIDESDRSEDPKLFGVSVDVSPHDPVSGTSQAVAPSAVLDYAPAARASSAVSPTVNAIHWLSAGLISFARGWNDTPKIAALSLLALSGIAHGPALGFIIVTLAMAAGGVVMGRKVLETLATKLTPLPLAESLTASMVTATLVGLASWYGLPVSTTHVATGSILGAGLKNNPRAVTWAKVGEIVVSWVVTLPVAALIAGGARLALR